MKRLASVAFCVIAFTVSVQAQPYFTELRGFKLKQYREVTRNELGRPYKSERLEDGFENDQYVLKADGSLYMVFEYAANQTDVIWSIQISGSDPTADLGFRELRFGLDRMQVEKQFGKPTSKVDIGEYGQRWEYGNSNVSFEINPKGKLSSIKIKDISNEVYSTPDAKKIPRFADVLRILTSRNKAEIAKLMAPDIEIYLGGETVFFAKSIKTELATDDSKVFSVIQELAEDLKDIKGTSSDEYEENIRVIVGQSTKHVIKFKKAHKIRELVFNYGWGEFLLWEIQAGGR